MASILLKEFRKRIAQKEIKIAVVGLGYVGLPLAVTFTKNGFSVLGIDLDKDRISQIKKGKSYITDVSDKELRQVLATGRFKAGSNFSALKDTAVVLICVPTPLKRKYHPNISYIKQATKFIAKNLKKPSLVVLESTTYPGTTEEVILPLLKQHNLRHNQDFYLCFSPERIDPGNKVYPVNKIPKIVGGMSKEATDLAVLVYRNIIDKVVPVSSPRTAEAVKLLENTFRLINIGLIDELAMMCHRMNIDIWEVINAAKTKPFGFMPFYPGPGVGGSCIPKDPLYLYWKARHQGFKSRFIKLAAQIISRMPEYVVERVINLLRNKALNKIKVLLIGVTYKKDIKDLRKSPALDIIDILQKRQVRVAYYDPLIPYLKLNHINLKSINLKQKRLEQFDCVIIATDHSGVDYDFILKHAKLVFDTRNVYKNIVDKKIFRL
jgi:UDP-N-acetyl-D-glucosamine dehydrogenase